MKNILLAFYKLRPEYPHFVEITKTLMSNVSLNALILSSLSWAQSLPIIFRADIDYY